MKKRRETAAFFTALGTAGFLAAGCAFGGTGGSALSSAEEEYVQEQAVAAMSVEEGGTAYALEAAADPAFYQELDAETGTTDPSTGYRTVSLSLDLPYADAAVAAAVSYRLYDENGSTIAVYGDAVRAADIRISYSSSVQALRFAADTDLEADFSVSGLGTDLTTISGSFGFGRTAETSSAVPVDLATAFDAYGAVNGATFVYDEAYGRRILTGGTATLELSGNVNEASFAFSSEWVFKAGYQAALTFEGTTMTVDIESGSIAE